MFAFTDRSQSQACLCAKVTSALKVMWIRFVSLFLMACLLIVSKSTCMRACCCISSSLKCGQVEKCQKVWNQYSNVV
eukprot:5738296-Amphidinium_carterae.2